MLVFITGNWAFILIIFYRKPKLFSEFRFKLPNRKSMFHTLDTKMFVQISP